MIERIKDFYNSDSEQKSLRHKFWCDIVFVTLSLENNNLIIYMVQTRPCAQRCGFYRYLLWQLGRYVIEKKLERLVLDSCVEENIYILSEMGGFIDPNQGKYPLPNMYITLDDLKRYTSDKDLWKIPSSFPPASFLNDQNFVNRLVDDTEDEFKW